MLTLLKELPQATVARDEETLFFMERQRLMGRGIGYIDVHLLTAVALDGASRLWTRNKRLYAVAGELGLAHTQSDPL